MVMGDNPNYVAAKPKTNSPQSSTHTALNATARPNPINPKALNPINPNPIEPLVMLISPQEDDEEDAVASE